MESAGLSPGIQQASTLRAACTTRKEGRRHFDSAEEGDETVEARAADTKLLRRYSYCRCSKASCSRNEERANDRRPLLCDIPGALFAVDFIVASGHQLASNVAPNFVRGFVQLSKQYSKVSWLFLNVCEAEAARE